MGVLKNTLLGKLSKYAHALGVKTRQLERASLPGTFCAHEQSSRAYYVFLLLRKGRNQAGQMTVEFALMFPVILITALVAINALLFFSACASFDRHFNQSVVTFMSSPASGDGNATAHVQDDLSNAFPEDYLSISVSSSGVEGGLTSVTGVLRFSPTLFGHGTLRGAFGVNFPALEHKQSIVIDRYKPGVLL